MYADLVFIDHDGHSTKDVELPQPISKKTHFHHLRVSFIVDTRCLFRGWAVSCHQTWNNHFMYRTLTLDLSRSL